MMKMSKAAKIFAYISFVFAFCCIAIGYAAVQDELLVNGTVSVNGYFLKTDVSAADTEAYELKDGTLIISDTYYNSQDGKNYHVVGIAKDGFSSSSLSGAAKVDPTEVLSISIPKDVVNIGETAFSGLANLTYFTVASENTKYKVDDGVLFDIDGKTLVRYPPNKLKSYYIVPSTVTTIKDGAFDSAGRCTAIVTTLYDDGAWGSPSAIMINTGDLINEIDRIEGSVDTGYTVTFTNGSPEETVVFQGNDDPDSATDPSSKWYGETFELVLSDSRSVSFEQKYCQPCTHNHYAQVYLSSWKMYAYGYVPKDSATLEIYNCKTAIVAGGVYQFVDENNHRFIEMSNIYKLPTGSDPNSTNLGTVSWGTVAQTIKKVDVKNPIAPLSTNSWFKNFSNCSEYYSWSNLEFHNISDATSMFEGAGVANSAKTVKFDHSKFGANCGSTYTTMTTMFKNANLSMFDLSSLGHGRPINATTNMFEKATLGTDKNGNPYTHLDLSSLMINGSSVTGMFREIENMVTLDISNPKFFYRTVQRNLKHFVYNCKDLVTIYVGNNFGASDNGDQTFFGCDNLVGGNGTKLGTTSGGTGPTYACIDGMKGQIGYFTCIVQPKIDETLSGVVWDFGRKKVGNEVQIDFTVGEDSTIVLKTADGTLYNGTVILDNGDGITETVTVTDGNLSISAQFMVAKTSFTIKAAQ